MNSTDWADLMNWVGWITIVAIVAITLTIVRVKEIKYGGVREDTSGESKAEGDTQT